MQFIYQPARSNRLGDYIGASLNGRWTRFRAAIAFAKRSGTKHIVGPLAKFAKTNDVEIIVGIDHHGTSKEGLQDLLNAVSPKGRVVVFHNRLPITFHPKIYLFGADNSAEIIIGSGNLTEGGLFTNYEGCLRLHLDLSKKMELAILQSVEDILDAWVDPSKGLAFTLDTALLARLVALGLVPLEALSAPERGAEYTGRAGSSVEDIEEPAQSPFAAHTEPRAPSVPRATLGASTTVGASPTASMPAASARAAISPSGVTGFVMTLQQTDVGVGQTTRGTSRRSPEIFIPLSARDANPDFWGWQSGFTEDPRKRGKFDRQGVRMRIGTETVSVNMMTWPVKHDFRLRSEALRSAGNIGDIMRIEKVDPSMGFDYYVEVIPQGTTQYSVYLALCTEPVRNSRKVYGYY